MGQCHHKGPSLNAKVVKLCGCGAGVIGCGSGAGVIGCGCGVGQIASKPYHAHQVSKIIIYHDFLPPSRRGSYFK